MLINVSEWHTKLGWKNDNSNNHESYNCIIIFSHHELYWKQCTIRHEPRGLIHANGWIKYLIITIVHMRLIINYNITRSKQRIVTPTTALSYSARFRHWVDFRYRCIRLRAVKMTFFQIDHIAIWCKYAFTTIRRLNWKLTSLSDRYIRGATSPIVRGLLILYWWTRFSALVTY